MKKILSVLVLLLFINSVFVTEVQAFSFNIFKSSKKEKVEPQDFSEVELNVKEEDKLQIQKNEPVKTIDNNTISETDAEKIEEFKKQRKDDIEDITNLWKATVENNNVIKFAIKKVTMNPEERKKHSSTMARSISALINGATLLPYLFGMNATIASAAAAGTSLAAQAAKNKLGYGMQNIPVTDTELIQLASLIEDLQTRLITNYYSYKSSIELLKDCRSKLAVYKKNYNQALQTKNEANILVTKALYEKQQLEELRLKNEIKTAKIELERFAGENVVNNLHLARVRELNLSNSGGI